MIYFVRALWEFTRNQERWWHGREFRLSALASLPFGVNRSPNVARLACRDLRELSWMGCDLVAPEVGVTLVGRAVIEPAEVSVRGFLDGDARFDLGQVRGSRADWQGLLLWTAEPPDERVPVALIAEGPFPWLHDAGGQSDSLVVEWRSRPVMVIST